MDESILMRLGDSSFAIVPAYTPMDDPHMFLTKIVYPMPHRNLVWRIVNINTGKTPDWAAESYETPDMASDAYHYILKTQPELFRTRLEVNKLLTLSTAHLTEKTRRLLDENPETDCLHITSYPKAEFGWYVYWDCVNIHDSPDGFPEDLRAALAIAETIGANVVCFDCDAEPIPSLPVYDDQD